MNTPIDYRNITWKDIQSRVTGLRQRVYRDLLKYGPCTTRQLAERSGIDLLSVRPRITELITLGLAELVQENEVKGEGTYRGVQWFIAEARFNAALEKSRNPQLDLAL